MTGVNKQSQENHRIQKEILWNTDKNIRNTNEKYKIWYKEVIEFYKEYLENIWIECDIWKNILRFMKKS